MQHVQSFDHIKGGKYLQHAETFDHTALLCTNVKSLTRCQALAATLAGEPVAQRFPSQKSQVTQGSRVSRFSVFCHALPPHIAFLTLKKNYNLNFSGALLSPWKRHKTSTSPMSLSRAVINYNNTNNNIINERPPFL